jgi:hypothetical protein
MSGEEGRVKTSLQKGSVQNARTYLESAVKLILYNNVFYIQKVTKSWYKHVTHIEEVLSRYKYFTLLGLGMLIAFTSSRFLCHLS